MSRTRPTDLAHGRERLSPVVSPDPPRRSGSPETASIRGRARPGLVRPPTPGAAPSIARRSTAAALRILVEARAALLPELALGHQVAHALGDLHADLLADRRGDVESD